MTTDHVQHVFYTDTPRETEQLAAALARSVSDAAVIALTGELGAGKTCFVRGLARGLDINAAEVSSPTYVIVHEYPGGDRTLIHIDAYRLSGPDELETIGWDEMLEGQEAVMAIEWPGRIAEAIPDDAIAVDITDTARSAESTTRRITISAAAPILTTTAATMNVKARACRTCDTAVHESSSTFPFCSNRCRLADLGDWFAEKNVVSRPMQAGDWEVD